MPEPTMKPKHSVSDEFEDHAKPGSEKGPASITQTNGPVAAEERPRSPEEIAMNRRINRKMDVALLPLLSLIYLFNGLDRSNVGNAETQGMWRSLSAEKRFTPPQLMISIVN